MSLPHDDASPLQDVLCRVICHRTVYAYGRHLDGRPGSFWPPGTCGYFAAAVVAKFEGQLAPEPEPSTPPAPAPAPPVAAKPEPEPVPAKSEPARETAAAPSPIEATPVAKPTPAPRLAAEDERATPVAPVPAPEVESHDADPADIDMPEGPGSARGLDSIVPKSRPRDAVQEPSARDPTDAAVVPPETAAAPTPTSAPRRPGARSNHTPSARAPPLPAAPQSCAASEGEPHASR